MLLRRLNKEFNDIQNTKLKGIRVQLKSEDDMSVWIADIDGPEDTEFAGGIFRLQLVFPPKYPHKPPEVKFLSNNIYHPNVYSSGKICLDILQNQWSPMFTAEKVLLSIISLLTDPNPDSPANVVAAKDYRTDRELYRSRVISKIHSSK